MARWMFPALRSSNQMSMNDDWRRIFRSLIFMDNWLSYTLGYTPEATPSDIQVSWQYE
jgi:hypothetical protein